MTEDTINIVKLLQKALLSCEICMGESSDMIKSTAKTEETEPTEQSSRDRCCRLDAFVLLSGVQACLNRIDSLNRRNPISSYTTLYTIVNDHINSYRGGERSAVSKSVDIHETVDSMDVLEDIRFENIDGLPVVSLAISKDVNSIDISEEETTRVEVSFNVVVVSAGNLLGHGLELKTISCPVYQTNSKKMIPVLSALFDSIGSLLNSSSAIVPSGILYSPLDNAKQRSRKWGSRIFIQYDLQEDKTQPVNLVSSWLVGQVVRGDTVVADCSIDRLADVSIASFQQVIKSTLPSNIWTWSADFMSDQDQYKTQFQDVSETTVVNNRILRDSYLSHGLYRLPTRYSPEIWNLNGSIPNIKKPMSILRDIVSRRTGTGSVSIHKTPCTLKQILEQPLKVSESIPRGWWSTKDEDYEPRNVKKTVSNQLKSTHMKVYLSLPISDDLFKASGLNKCYVYPSQAITEPLNTESIEILEWQEQESSAMRNSLDEIEQEFALIALHLLEDSATEALTRSYSSDKPPPEIIEAVKESDCHDGSTSYRVCFDVTFSYIHSANDDKTPDNLRNLSITYTNQVFMIGYGMISPCIEEAIKSRIDNSSFSSDTSFTETWTTSTLFTSSAKYWNWLYDPRQCLPATPTTSDPADHKIITNICVRSWKKYRFVASKLNAFHPRLFEPSLADQRRNIVSAIINSFISSCWKNQCDESRQSISWLDAGCGNGSFILNYLNHMSHLSLHDLHTIQYNILGIDINANRLVELQRSLEMLIDSKKIPNCMESIILTEGSLLDKELYKQLIEGRSIQVVTCIEVIEHLPTIEDAINAVVSILLFITPKLLIVSTPNHEANDMIMHEISRLYRVYGFNCSNMDQWYDDDDIQSDSGSVDDSFKNNSKFRELDHKFEFTRSEFRDYLGRIISITQSHGLYYDIEIVEVGKSLPGCEVTGGATQVAVLRIQNNHRSLSYNVTIGCPSGNGYTWNWMKAEEYKKD